MIAQILGGPWLNFEEVTQKTGLVKNEILYAIQTQQITPVIYTNNRPFLAYSKNQHNQLIGHARFQYSGTLAINLKAIREIVVNDQTILSREPVKLLCPDQMMSCSTDYHFNADLPNGLLDDWKPNQDIFSDSVSIMIQPYEYSTYEDAESVIVDFTPRYYCEDEFLAAHADRLFVRSPHAKYVYGSYDTHVFHQKDLRFPLEAIHQLLNPKQPRKPDKPPRLRNNELHNVIRRAIDENPKEQSGTIWNILRRDSQQENREYDYDHVIDSINHETIQWVSASGIRQTLKKSSFKIIVSRLKKSN